MVGLPRRPYKNYDKWKDFWVPIQNKKFDIDIIWGINIFIFLYQNVLIIKILTRY
jgi:hypothetical protein